MEHTETRMDALNLFPNPENPLEIKHTNNRTTYTIHSKNYSTLNASSPLKTSDKIAEYIEEFKTIFRNEIED